MGTAGVARPPPHPRAWPTGQGQPGSPAPCLPPAGRHHPTAPGTGVTLGRRVRAVACRPSTLQRVHGRGSSCTGGRGPRPAPRADTCVFPCPCPARWAGGQTPLPRPRGRGRHLDERGCCRDLPVEVLLSLLLLDLQGEAGAEDPLGGQKAGSRPADVAAGGGRAGGPLTPCRCGSGRRASWAPWAQLRTAGPADQASASREPAPGEQAGGLSGPPLGVCAQGGPHPHQPPEPRGS